MKRFIKIWILVFINIGMIAGVYFGVRYKGPDIGVDEPNEPYCLGPDSCNKNHIHLFLESEGGIKIVDCNKCPPGKPEELVICPHQPNEPAWRIEPNEPFVIILDPNDPFDITIKAQIDPTIVIAMSNEEVYCWSIELMITETGLCLTGDLDRLNDAAEQFFNKYLKEICDEYLERNNEPNEPEIYPETLADSEALIEFEEALTRSYLKGKQE